MRAAIVQFRPKKADVDANLQTIRKSLVRRRFDLAVLPELATTGYNFSRRDEIRELAEDLRGKSFAFMAELAAKTDGAIVWGMIEKDGRKIYNSAILTTPEGDHHVYRKTHLFFREKLIFDPGDTGFKVFTWRKVRIGLMICFDWIFPEAARALALGGSQIICHPSNLVMHYCQDAMVTRSLENGVYCLTANRVGTEKVPEVSLTFTGRSQITDPKGRRILRFGETEEGFRSVKITPESSDIKNMNRFNNLFADRRVGMYSLVCRRKA
jgi:predicted amidohydrolase